MKRSTTLCALGAAASCSAATGAMSVEFTPYPGDASGRIERVQVSTPNPTAPLRHYTIKSSQAQRDHTPPQRIVKERPGVPRVRSGNLLFDALFAQAVDDARLNSVSEIRDSAYNEGQAIPATVFQTGEKWSYVWTRDLAYAADLGLAWLDPARVVHSLRFKTSAFREGFKAPDSLPPGSSQIVQDTGSGGSWPVSTDRVSWAWGAEAALAALAPDERAVFARQAYDALRGSIAADREAAFDPACGLYGGEQSFLDWRTQTYAPWITQDLSRMAASRALSTNVGHYQALHLAAGLASEFGNDGEAARYAGWAEQLKAAINQHFWLADVKRYASVTSADAAPIALHQFDMLGTALAVISGVAPPERAADALAHYPHAPYGVPVIEPQQPQVYVYHNRAIWPFVSAYALRAAALTRNPAMAAHAVDSLMRAAALNLSNMENLEWLTAKPQFDDGPAINSRCQLWSVGAYLGMVAESIFGLHYEAGSLRIAPFLTAHTRKLLGQGGHSNHSGQAHLLNMRYKGRPFSVTLRLPAAASQTGYYAIQEVRLNGRPVAQGRISAQQLKPSANSIEVRFGALLSGDARLSRVPSVDPLSHDDARVFAPEAPTELSASIEDGQTVLRWVDVNKIDAVRSYTVYRDGQLAQAGLSSPSWTDPLPPASALRRSYAVQAQFEGSGHRSQLSAPFDVDPPGSVQRLALGDALQIQAAGDYGIELVYSNSQMDISTGVTNAVKRLRVLDATGAEQASGIVQMPHVQPEGSHHPLRGSTLLRLKLAAGRYRLDLQDYFNMSALASNARYSGAGGRAGVVNEAQIDSIRVIRLK